jgi:hypothetical protein
MSESHSIETQYLLYLLRQWPCNVDDSSCCGKFTQLNEIDYVKFVNLAVKNGVASLIYLKLKKTGFLSGEIAERLKAIYRQTVLSNLGQLAELLRVLDICRENCVAIVPLKGVVDAEKLFNDLGAYPSSDIDLLVPVSELPTLCVVLNQHGYSSIEGIDETDLLSSHYHLIYRKNASCLELHWNLVKRYFVVPPDFWWQGVTKGTHSGREITELATEKYLLYLIFRLFDHQFAPLKFMVHISTFIAHSPQLNWDKLVYYSELFGMKRLVLFCLQLVHDQFGAKVPVELRHRKIFGYKYLRNMVLEQNFNRRTRPHLAMMYFSCFLIPPQVNFKIISSRIFSTKSEVRLRYGLNPDSKAIYLYMIFNPLLMLFRRK